MTLLSSSTCLHCLHSRFCHNGFALNSNKSKTILLGISSHIRNSPAVSGVTVAGTVLPLSDRIITLGVTLDSSLTFRHHVSNICRSAHFHLRALCHIRGMFTKDTAKTLATSIIHSRIDYTNLLFMATHRSRDCSLYRTQLPGWY